MPMYSIEELKELINTVDNSGVTALQLEGADGEKLSIKKKTYVATAPTVVTTVETTTQSVATDTQPRDAAAKSDKTINSPMVGVFYSAASPDADDYVSVGSAVNKGDVVCIIEAMKLMNEITATESGKIEEVLVENGQIVEFGQPLYRLS